MYHALSSLRPELKIKTLTLGLKSPMDENGNPDCNIDNKRKKEYVDSCMDWEVMNWILSQRQFRELKDLLFEFN